MALLPQKNWVLFFLTPFLFSSFCLAEKEMSSKTSPLSSAEHSVIEKKVDEKCVKNLIVQPKGQLMINEQAPWLIKLKNSDDSSLRIAPSKSGDKLVEYDLSKLYQEAGAQEENLELAVSAFVCTKDKKTCYRDVHQVSIGSCKNQVKK